MRSGSRFMMRTAARAAAVLAGEMLALNMRARERCFR